MRKTKWPGNWKYDCPRCSFTFPSSDIRKEWTGLYVCRSCWEPKHPQLMIKIRPETAVPAFTNNDNPIQNFVSYCDINGIAAFADMGTADCMQVGKTSPSYDILLDTLTNGH